jgi:hypothetical protein
MSSSRTLFNDTLYTRRAEREGEDDSYEGHLSFVEGL